ncbi:MAG: hypothetical protein PHW52_03995 [Candidatus Pacebacteria bacterium]|nr:hypothetical protein [Candidatus Paceibacterota bacterium]
MVCNIGGGASRIKIINPPRHKSNFSQKAQFVPPGKKIDPDEIVRMQWTVATCYSKVEVINEMDTFDLEEAVSLLSSAYEDIAKLSNWIEGQLNTVKIER